MTTSGHPSSRLLVNSSLDYTDNHVDQDLHPAFSEIGIDYNSETDCFSTESDTPCDDSALSDSQRAFQDALQEYQKGVETKYKSKVDLQSTHSWGEVMKQVEVARREYEGKSCFAVFTSQLRHMLRKYSTT